MKFTEITVSIAHCYENRTGSNADTIDATPKLALAGLRCFAARGVCPSPHTTFYNKRPFDRQLCGRACDGRVIATINDRQWLSMASTSLMAIDGNLKAIDEGNRD